VGKNSVIYMGLISGPNKADDTCRKTTVTGMMARGSTVHTLQAVSKCTSYCNSVSHFEAENQKKHVV
jgi:hypothetical protein